MFKRPSLKNRVKKRFIWNNKNKSPEEIFLDPNLYFRGNVIERYSTSKNERRIQQEIASRVLDFLGLEEGAHLLDLGCGPGYSSEFFRALGYRVSGIDIIPEMVERAKENGLEAYVCDMRSLSIIFNEEIFDGAFSISAFQWLREREDKKRAALEIYRVLKFKAPLILQFYPTNSYELDETKNIFKRNGFLVELVIDNPNTKHQRIYLVMKKI